MTRVELLRHFDKLKVAALSREFDARIEVGKPATDQEIAKCESALAANLPEPYKTTLREWNGAHIEIYASEDEVDERGDARLHADFVISDTKWIAATTRVLREVIAEAMAGSEVAAEVAEAMSRIAVISARDDIYVFLTCDDNEPGDLTVQYIDLAYALSEFPPTMRVVAASPDEYLQRCVAHLSRTLQSGTYWW